MGIEIERKFLVVHDSWREQVERSVAMRQGYLANTDRASVRVRRAGSEAYVNIKSMTLDVVRAEYDYSIPPDEADELLDRLCQPALIDKTRHYVRHAGHLWEIDVFEGANRGLIVAEIELPHPETAFERPRWCGAEVSSDERYFNVYLARHPYCDW